MIKWRLNQTLCQSICLRDHHATKSSLSSSHFHSIDFIQAISFGSPDNQSMRGTYIREERTAYWLSFVSEINAPAAGLDQDSIDHDDYGFVSVKQNATTKGNAIRGPPHKRQVTIIGSISMKFQYCSDSMARLTPLTNQARSLPNSFDELTSDSSSHSDCCIMG